MAAGPGVKTFLWYPTQAYDAAKFYVDIFPNSRIVSEFRSPVQTTVQAGDVLTCDFELNGRSFVALNGNPSFPFNKSISILVSCSDQDEIDYYWSRLTADGGSEVQCGWLTDKFGLSWQVAPTNMTELISTPPGMHAMMQMKKLDIAALRSANQR